MTRAHHRRFLAPWYGTRSVRLQVRALLAAYLVVWALPFGVLAQALVRSTPGTVVAGEEDAPEPKNTAGITPQNLDDLKALEKRFRQIAKQATACTVAVRAGPSRGSGVIVSEDGLVMTAAHVAERAGHTVTVIMADERVLTGKTLGVNQSKDIGLIRITDEVEDLPHLPLGDANALSAGHWVMSLGHPGGYRRGRKPVPRVGRVLDRRVNVILTDCTLVGGDSGGPLVDLNGKLVGIHSRIGESLAANLHVPVNLYRRKWERLPNGQELKVEVSREGPFIGVFGDPATDEAIIHKMAPGSPAEKAGMQVGDVVVVFDGRGVGDFDALVRMVRTKTPGKKVTAIVRRGNELITLSVGIASREDSP